MTTAQEDIHSSRDIGRVRNTEVFDILSGYIERSGEFWPHVPTHTLESAPDSSQKIGDFETRLDEFERNLQAAVEIALENRNLLRQLQEGESRVGLGVIHSLDQGRVQLNPPLFYRYQMVDDDVVVSIEDLGVYGVGSTEGEAAKELQDELWGIFQDIEQTPSEEIGTLLARILRTIKARIQ